MGRQVEHIDALFTLLPPTRNHPDVMPPAEIVISQLGGAPPAQSGHAPRHWQYRPGRYL